MTSLDIPGLVHGSPGFVATLGPRVLSVDPARLRLDAGPELHDHLGGPHAAAILGLGETTAFVVLLRVLGDLVEAGAVAAREVVADRLQRGRDRSAAGRGDAHR